MHLAALGPGCEERFKRYLGIEPGEAALPGLPDDRHRLPANVARDQAVSARRWISVRACVAQGAVSDSRPR
jgi:hypothetical protein